ncbi:MAG: helix-turn-helix domain-containing protein [Flavobacteriaceae bacterium]
MDISRIISEENIEIFKKTFEENPQENLTEWKRILPKDFDFHDIRLLWNYFRYLENKK